MPAGFESALEAIGACIVASTSSPTVGSTDRGLRCLFVADFTDHNDIGACRKMLRRSSANPKPMFKADLRLADAWQNGFNRVFNRVDFSSAIGQVLEGVPQRCCFPSTCWSRHQSSPAGVPSIDLNWAI